MATKRISRWPREWREWFLELSSAEREFVLLAVAYLDARPEEFDAG